MLGLHLVLVTIHMRFTTTPNIPISEGGTNSSHTHNVAKSQSYRGLEFLLSVTKIMNTCSYMLVVIACDTCFSVNSAKC
jgi:hypothetical protein